MQTSDYFALLAYIEMNDTHQMQLQAIRQMIRDAKQVATGVGFGPRFLHSTGQAYKGGTNGGVFLQITYDDAIDLLVPQQKYTFGVVKAAQARGEFQVLVDLDRRALRVHLSTNVGTGLATLQTLIQQSWLNIGTGKWHLVLALFSSLLTTIKGENYAIGCHWFGAHGRKYCPTTATKPA